ncbi:substrate-binding domain-containing protein [Phytohabitans rumicis]|uniref:Periplasmic binding protein domain-containing protein n=1 Tax=Phytohabitans rumicis TaxID=1076125 RepID=A0A6V8KWN3_9ACTN|nr:substrate-binding domain-containing protein [Phytohabitans rumicis]GFJ87790.1 hypothetical protein Prum_014320 [Phytohabitans rumicis]
MSPSLSRAPRRLGRLHLAALASATAALLLSACSSADSGTPSAGGSEGSLAAAGTCGSVPTVAPKDPQNLVGKLPQNVAAAYNGYTSEVLPSHWTNWKPSHPGPYKVGIVWDPPVNAFQTATLASLKSTLEKSGNVQIVASVAPQSQADVPGHLQLFNQLVASKPDLIIVEPLAPAPYVGAIDAAGKAGIPVVAAWSPVPSAYSVGVGINNWLQAATLASKVAAKMGGKGTVLMVHGIPGVQQDSDAFAGFKAALALCPDIKIAGEVTGNYNSAATKAATLQFLATHPGRIDGVLQSGVMTTGVIQAFQQLGRPVPAIADGGSTEGSIAFAYQNKDTYTQFGTSTPDVHIGRVFAEVALRILRGDGPVLNQMITQPKYITAENLDTVYKPGWQPSSPGDAALPDDTFMTDQELAAFFRVQG